MKRTLALCTLALTTTSAIAADAGYYLYAAAGQATTARKAEIDTVIRNLGITAFTSSAKESYTASKVQAGLRINPHFALEGGYINLGKFSYDAASTAPIVATRTGRLNVAGWNYGVVLSTPISASMSLFAKGGAFAYQLDYQCYGTGIPCDRDRSASGTPLYYGAGADWRFSDTWFARAEFEMFKDIGEKFNDTGTTGTTRADVMLVSIGVGYRF